MCAFCLLLYCFKLLGKALMRSGMTLVLQRREENEDLRAGWESTKPLEPLILLILIFRNNFLLFFQNQVNKNNRLWPFIDNNYMKMLGNDNREVKDEKRKEVLVFYVGLEPFLWTLLPGLPWRVSDMLTTSPHSYFSLKITLQTHETRYSGDAGRVSLRLPFQTGSHALQAVFKFAM